ncbi:MAG TPA: sigma-70 family RNA polymerase sigma factor, partial [Kofleriaceae bacterium]
MSDRGAEELLVHAGWLRALALRLVRDDDVADDLVQDTWIATMRRAPERSESEKSWLARVLLNRLRMRARSEGRRTAREQATLLIGDDDVPTQDVLIARAETQRKLVELVLRLDEPYRATVLLHFCEGVPLAQIARTQGIPASTVRWRLKTALDQLREGLDAETGGRKQWAVPLLVIPKGVLVAQKTSKLVAAAIVLLLLLVGGWLLLRDRSSGNADRSRTAGSGTPGTVLAGAVPTALGADTDRPAWLIQPDVKPRRIAGRVTFRGAPAAGATVELASLATESGLGVPLQRTTNAAGEFDFGPQPAMGFSVRASAPRRASAMLDVDLRNPLVRSDKLELSLGACDAAMHGTVRDASGGAIAKARIARLDVDSHGNVPGGPAMTTAENGEYELCVETRWPPDVTVEVSAAGYGTIVYTAMVPGRVKTDFALVPEATIVGRVIRDDTREPVAQAYVYVPAGPGGVQRTGWRATFSDASGRFRLDRLAPGRHLVFARAEGLADAARGVPVGIEAGQTSAEIEIRLEVGSTIRGRVVDGDKPIAGARVAVTSRSAYSQDDGSYVLTGVVRGEVKFTAMPYDVVKPRTFQVSQPLHDGVVIDVEPLGTITGLVVRGRDPVPGAAVYLNGPNGRELDSVFADAKGRFVARGLRAGPWDVAAGSQHLGAFGTAPQIVQLARGQTVDVTIDMRYAASISGRVVDHTGAPVPGVTVAFEHTGANDVGMGTTAADGSFKAATMTGGGQYRPRLSTMSSMGARSAPLRPATGDEF